MNPYDHLFKILLVGDSGVGKSSLMLRFCDDTFNERQLATIGVDFRTKHLVLKRKNVKLAVWDTAGQERFRTMTSSYYRGAQGVILAFDVTSAETFYNLPKWISEVRSHSTHEKAKLLLVGNKVDLANERQVSREKAEEYAESNGMKYVETSARTNIQVGAAFAELAGDILEEPELLPNTSPDGGGGRGSRQDGVIGIRAPPPDLGLDDGGGAGGKCASC
mmetsp:Transcript_18595/g.46411  ORF Transcript_18595/g.46411 Transcript_18595/m.46411 type:complete len:220 (+) Transcript_18595:277-936(+)|eukprot:CAMPEP_0178999136 /NCGR_PEP_ID=MMETSP0795-20121207/9885_1 /TAXON_ID=88552 /ORGANISM="Amoebophrya sp., Strain Ameob2" /LENGTH=219 /DNA_ID=CAMNT_0020691861 /DNA_START=274 /DNA_END=933 /DNA_ORIENTATION=+